jgi:purine nucleosidase
VRQAARTIGVVIGALLALLLLSFAVPVSTWRTGELPAPLLATLKGGPLVEMPRRIWIDTDAACGHARSDPDDCFALLLLLRSPDIEVVGISTSYGNAPLSVTDRTVRDLVTALAREGVEPVPVYRGSVAPSDDTGNIAAEPAHAALRNALERERLTLVGLGPLTNIALALKDRRDLQANVGRLVVVMGRRPGHLFHPAEGRSNSGMLFGHGPVFRDFNFDQDRAAAVSVLNMRLPMTFVPYDAAREVSLTGADMARMRATGGAAAWVATRAQAWLDYWKRDVGLPGFYPFDALAAAYVMEPKLLDCAHALTWIGHDDSLWRVLYNPPVLLVGPPQRRPDGAQAIAHGVYCERTDAGLHDWLLTRLVRKR